MGRNELGIQIGKLYVTSITKTEILQSWLYFPRVSNQKEGHSPAAFRSLLNYHLSDTLLTTAIIPHNHSPFSTFSVFTVFFFHSTDNPVVYRFIHGFSPYYKIHEGYNLGLFVFVTWYSSLEQCLKNSRSSINSFEYLKSYQESICQSEKREEITDTEYKF